jgi:hypothetical protein
MTLVKYNALNIFTCNGIRLLPGVNEVNEEVLKSLLVHPLFKWRVDQDIIHIFEVPKEVDGKMSLKDLLKHIPSIFDKELLSEIVKNDGRAPAVKAAKEQIAKISAEKKGDEATNVEHFN